MNPALQSHALRVLIFFSLTAAAAAQVPASFQAPMLGHLFDAGRGGIIPIVGIPGNSRIEAALPLALSLEKVAFLPDQRHAIVSSSERPEALVLDLKESTSTPIPGTSSSFTAVRTNSAGTGAAFYYAGTNNVVVVAGVPATPAIHATIDVSFGNGPLRQFALSDEGDVALLVFSSADGDLLYTWTGSAGPRFVLTSATISDLAFLGEEDAVIVDSSADQALLIRNVRQQATPTLLASAREGLSQPSAVFISTRNEIYISNTPDLVLVLDGSGHVLRRTPCGCRITTIARLANSALRLTDRIDQPLILLDGSESDRVLFVPAFSPPATEGSR
jgi:hypothetical protein